MRHTWLHAGRRAVFAIAVACTPLTAQQATTPARSQDVASPQAVVTALYDVISGPAARPRDWNRFRSLFLEDARLVFVFVGPTGRQWLYNLPVEEFITTFGPGYQSGAGYWEREISHHEDRFGTIAHVFSTYETRLEGPKAEVAGRGINGIQLLLYEGRWWITSLVFDSENGSNPIPPQFLGAAGG
jgi:hypothetical protein